MGLLSKMFGARARVAPYGLWGDDAEQLAAFEARGAEPGAPRESEFFISFTSDVKAKAAADVLRTQRVYHELVEPSHDIPEWMIFVRGYQQPLVPDFLRETVDLCSDLAARFGGEYEGWAGLLTAEEKGGE
ncbi:ribonuclease E inhibitor RraB [Demequina capsici]|uniref:Ribonuclease E inhibitor RraB n=1 Tax=Demequina capsici TaxID=3075620 RepID=A0AA96FAP6_9MICO|nr:MULTISPECIES: ribonuclease E inhibitor RraB [unclassified Demequina]WNM25877.1 ribonuclease E inhibitor RraB [Demequina sp. OYTSA14]WNM28773.1 ribonuclease E inhibitor RraB [Demequina sp. PMTSA13]